MERFQFLLVRPGDFVVVGVRWSGFEMGDGAEIVAVSDEAQIILTFPSQAMTEQLMLDRPFVILARRNARLGRPSTLVFRVRRGTRVFLTVGGVLEAVQGAEIVVGRVSQGLETTALEIPWGLVLTPFSPSGAAVTAQYASIVPISRSGAVPLWQADLRANDAGDGNDARLSLRPTAARLDDMVSGPAMLADHRVQIVTHAADEGPPRATRLRLSTLGGTLQASARWSDFAWDHDILLGRDQTVRFVSKGMLYPFGHRATLTEEIERALWDPPAPSPPPSTPPPPIFPEGPYDLPPEPKPGPDFVTPWPIATAGLHGRFQLRITDPVRAAVTDDPRLMREFPFDDVEILQRNFVDIKQPASLTFVPHVASSGRPLRFPVRCAHPSGDLYFSVPMLFVPDFATGPDDQTLSGLWAAHSMVPLQGVPIDLIRAPERQPGDVHEIHALRLSAERRADGFRPRITSFETELPALRTLVPGGAKRVAMAFDEAFLQAGELAAPLRPLRPISIDFVDRPSRSGGLIAPKFAADVISRTFGPVPEVALPSMAEGALAAFDGATLLGLPLASLIDIEDDEAPRDPPKIVPVLDGGKPVGARMEWTLQLKGAGPLTATSATRLTLTVEMSPDRSQTSCRLENFSYVLPQGSAKLLTLHFGAVEFTQTPGRPPDLQISGLTIDFSGELALLRDLATEVNDLLGSSNKPAITTTAEGITAAYSIGLPVVAAGMFVLRNITLRLGIEVPFSNKPVTASIGFSSRDNPFGLTVMGLGGGGYIDVRIPGAGPVGFEASLEFGALVEIDFVIARAEVHALGGVRFVTVDGGIMLDAFVRIGGSVELLGLISVSLELVVRLSYDALHNRLIGRASIVIEIDLTLISDTVTLDSGEWVLAGSSPTVAQPALSRPIERLQNRSDWQAYQETFAS